MRTPSPMTGSTVEETFSAVGIVHRKDLRCRCRCTMTIPLLPTILFSGTIKTYSTSTSNMGFTPGIHNSSYGALVIARSVTRTTPALRFPCSLIKSLSISSAPSFRMKLACLTIGCRSHWGPNSNATSSPGLKLSLTQDCSGPSHQINRSGLQFHALSELRP